MNKSNRFLKIVLIIVLLMWAGFIFYMSSKTADNSRNMSEGFTKNILSLFPPFHHLNNSAQNELISNLQTLVRKTAHATIYMILGIFASALTFCYNIKIKTKIMVASTGCLLYAISDELHQLFVAGRSCEVRDVCIDFLGVCVGIGLTYVIKHLLFAHPKKQR